jgi:hypothetical protein
MNPLLAGIGKLLGKFADNTQGRIERLKNEKSVLIKERDKIINKSSICTFQDADRIAKIYNRIDAIQNILENNSKD